jgi:hypothetical protein
MASELIHHVNDLLSSFMSLVFDEADRRNLVAARTRTTRADHELRRSMLLEKDFRDLMESAILNNGALSDGSIRALSQYPGITPLPDRATWGIWGEHFESYQRTHSINFSAGMASVMTHWIRLATSWGARDPLGGANIEVRPSHNCELMLFRCLQHVVHTIIFRNPWLYLPSCQSPDERDSLLLELNKATQTALVMEHVRVEQARTEEVVAELRRVFDDGYTPLTGPQPRLLSEVVASADYALEPDAVVADLDSEASASLWSDSDESDEDTGSDEGSISYPVAMPALDVLPNSRHAVQLHGAGPQLHGTEPQLHGAEPSMILHCVLVK